MTRTPNIIAITPIRTVEAEADWNELCRIKDTLWARNKQVVQIQPKPEDEMSDVEAHLVMKASINDVLMADALIYMPYHEMASDVRLRIQVAKSVGCAVLAWDERAGEKLAEMF